MSMFYFLQRQSQTVSETQLCCGPTNTNTPEMSENEWCRVQNKWLGANALLNGLCQQVNCNLELYVNLMLSVLCFELSRLTSPKHNRHKLIHYSWQTGRCSILPHLSWIVQKSITRDDQMSLGLACTTTTNTCQNKRKILK